MNFKILHFRNTLNINDMIDFIFVWTRIAILVRPRKQFILSICCRTATREAWCSLSVLVHPKTAEWSQNSTFSSSYRQRYFVSRCVEATARATHQLYGRSVGCLYHKLHYAAWSNPTKLSANLRGPEGF